MNVLVIFADDMRSDLMRYMPFTNGFLRANGVLFPNARQSTPVCQAARIGFLTGQYANGALNGVYGNPDGIGSIATDSIALWLQDEGVTTAIMGKAPNDWITATPQPGFDRWNVIVDNLQYPYTCTWADGVGGHAASTDHEVEHGADLVIDFLTNTAGDKFCWWTPTNPHVQHNAPFAQNPLPLTVPKFSWRQFLPTFLTDDTKKPTWISALDNLDETARRIMQRAARQQLREVYDLDQQIERVYDALVDEGIEDETYIIFTSDNGVFYGEQRDQNPLGASKDCPYEAAAKVPLMIWGSGVPRGGTNLTPTAASQDVAATVLDIFNATGIDQDGTSLLSLITTPQLDRATLYLRQDSTTNFPDCEGIATIDRKLNRYIDGTGTPAIDLVATPTDEFEMYYIDSDPDELDNKANDGGAFLTERNRLEGILDELL